MQCSHLSVVFVHRSRFYSYIAQSYITTRSFDRIQSFIKQLSLKQTVEMSKSTEEKCIEGAASQHSFEAPQTVVAAEDIRIEEDAASRQSFEAPRTVVATTIAEKLPEYKDQVRERPITILPVAEGVPIPLVDGQQNDDSEAVFAPVLDSHGNLVRMVGGRALPSVTSTSAGADKPATPENVSVRLPEDENSTPASGGEGGESNRENSLRKHTIWAGTFIIVLLMIAVVVPLAVVLSHRSPPPPEPVVIDPREVAKLTAGNATLLDEFGRSVAYSGDTIVIGAHGDDDNGNRSGSIHVFSRFGTNDWMEQAKLTASDATAEDWFGYSVAIDGDTIVVGAVLGGHSGSVYIFIRSRFFWTEQAKLTPSNGAADAKFGMSVAINGDTVVVGASGDDTDSAVDAGSVYVFIRSLTDTWTEQARLIASNGAATANFGRSVAIDGSTAVVGANRDDYNGDNSGSVYVFVSSGSGWTEQAMLAASDGAAHDWFGWSVEISGESVFIGARLDDGKNDVGSVYHFTHHGTDWIEEHKLQASNGVAGDAFGASVAISGDILLVGAAKGNNQTGSAYIFTRFGESWTEQAELIPSNGTVNGRFGSSLTVSGDTVVIGARLDEVGGSAYVFELR